MSCWNVRKKLPGLADGALSAVEQADVRAHLESCADCAVELQRYRKLSNVMSRVAAAAPPANLPLRIRVAVSRARNQESWAKRAWSRVVLVFENILEPLALPATGGALSSALVFAVILQSLLTGMPLGAVPNDLPTNLLQPARLESLAPFQVLDSEENPAHLARHLVVEVTVDGRGNVADYQIVAGPDTREVRRHLDQLLMFSRFRPQMSFGRPIPGGRVVLSFSEIRVRG